jgi:hypothetical protein
MRGKRGRLIDKSYVYQLFRNRVYLGEAVHKGTSYPGEHKAIISKPLWDKVYSVLAEGPRGRAGRTRAQTPALLKGLIFGPTGCAMTPTHTRKGGRLYRYYIATDLLKHDAPACTVRRLSAPEIEGMVVKQVRGLLRAPEMIVRTWRAGRRLDNAMVKALARSFRWREMLEKETYTTIKEIGHAENIAETYVGRVVRLSLLAPAIVEAIMTGKQPPEMALPLLMRSFSPDWNAQCRSMLAPKSG